MASDIPRHKRQWYDGEERVATGALVMFGMNRSCRAVLPVDELPKEVRALMESSGEDEMLTLHHHGDPEIEVYVRNSDIMAIDVRWDKLDSLDQR